MMKHLREKILSKKKSIGSWMALDHYLIPDLMAEKIMEWLVIDMEHSTTDLSTMSVMIDKIKAKNIAPWIRLPNVDEVIIKKCLDAGATGLIAPMVKTKSDVEKLIKYSFYPPMGSRGVGLYKAQNFRDNFNEYVKNHIEEIVIIAQIEHIDALKDLDNILSVPRLDGILIGPYDLSSSMGFPGEYHRQEVKDALTEIKTKAKKHGKALGFHVVEPDHHEAIKRLEEGYDFLAVGVDFLYLKKAIKETAESLTQWLTKNA